MALKFSQEVLPDGVFHLLVDDGPDVEHVFAECARWCDVARAAEQGSSVYAAAYWERRPTGRSA